MAFAKLNIKLKYLHVGNLQKCHLQSKKKIQKSRVRQYNLQHTQINTTYFISPAFNVKKCQ